MENNYKTDIILKQRSEIRLSESLIKGILSIDF